MKIIRHYCLFICVILLLQLLCAPALAAEGADPSVTEGCHTIDSMVPLLGIDPKISNAEAVFLYETTTQTVMYSWNCDKQMHPASLVKILTALIAVEEGNLTDVVTIKASTLATVPENATSVDLVADEVVTLDQLLYCLLVGSANDAAAVIAEHIGGSQNAFVDRMNAYAQQLGCTDTNFTNAHGLHDEAQVTTARDMARILSAAMENELFRTYFSTSYYIMDATNKSEERDFESSNHMMHMETYEIYYDDRVVGGRTGVSDAGLQCLATAAKSNGMELVCVVLGSKSVYLEDGYTVKRIGGFAETTQLLDMGFKGFKTAQILNENQVMLQTAVSGGSSDVVIGTHSSAASVLPDGATTETLTFRYSGDMHALEAPVEKGAYVGEVEVWNGNVCVAYAPLYSFNKVTTKQVFTDEQSMQEKGMGTATIALIIVVLVVAVAVGFIVIRRVVRRRGKKGRFFGRNRGCLRRI